MLRNSSGLITSLVVELKLNIAQNERYCILSDSCEVSVVLAIPRPMSIQTVASYPQSDT